MIVHFRNFIIPFFFFLLAKTFKIKLHKTVILLLLYMGFRYCLNRV